MKLALTTAALTCSKGLVSISRLFQMVTNSQIRNDLNIWIREIIRKHRKGEYLFLYVILRIDLLFIPKKYH